MSTGLLKEVNIDSKWPLGGYDFINTARFWTVCTALTLGQQLTNDIPEHKVDHNLTDYSCKVWCFHGFHAVFPSVWTQFSAGDIAW